MKGFIRIGGRVNAVTCIDSFCIAWLAAVTARHETVAAGRTLAALGTPAPLANAVGEGPNHDGNGQITTSKLSTYAGMVSFLKDQDARQPAMELEVIGKTVKGRDIHLVKYLSDPAKPTILYLTQQHGNEQLTTEGALEFVKHLGTGKSGDVPDGVNILIVPMLNADGAMGDVNFPLDGYLASTWAAAPRPSAAMASPWNTGLPPCFSRWGACRITPWTATPSGSAATVT
jgi:hypothetical protein